MLYTAGDTAKMFNKQNEEANSLPPLLPYHCRTRLGWLRMGQIFVALLTVICTSTAFEFWHQGYQFFWILLTAGLVLTMTTSVTILYCMGMPETQPKLPWEPTMLVANGIFTVFYVGSFAMAAWAASLHRRHRLAQGGFIAATVCSAVAIILHLYDAYQLYQKLYGKQGLKHRATNIFTLEQEGRPPTYGTADCRKEDRFVPKSRKRSNSNSDIATTCSPMPSVDFSLATAITQLKTPSQSSQSVAIQADPNEIRSSQLSLNSFRTQSVQTDPAPMKKLPKLGDVQKIEKSDRKKSDESGRNTEHKRRSRSHSSKRHDRHHDDRSPSRKVTVASSKTRKSRRCKECDECEECRKEYL